MNVAVSVEQSSESERKIGFTIPHEEYTKRFNAKLNAVRRDVRLKGFRPGKAPINLVRQLVGDEVKGEVLSELIGEAYSQAVKDNDLLVVGDPRIDIDPVEEGKDVTAKAEVSLFPEPEITDFSGFKVEVELEPENPNSVEAEVEKLRDQLAEFVPLEGINEVPSNGFVRIDFDATVDGRRFDGSKRDGAIVDLSSDELPEGLVEGISGMQLNQTKEVEVKFPEETPRPELAGKTAIYSVTPRAVLIKKVIESEDELASKVGIEGGAIELRGKIAQRYQEEREKLRKFAVEQRVLEEIAERNKFEVPQALLDEEIKQILFELGAVNPREIDIRTLDIDNFREPLGDSADKRVRKGVIVTQLISQFEISPNDEDLENWLTNLAEKSEQSLEDFKLSINYPHSEKQLKHAIARDICMEKLIAGLEITVIEKKAEE